MSLGVNKAEFLVLGRNAHLPSPPAQRQTRHRSDFRCAAILSAVVRRPNAVSNAVDCAKFYSRSHRAVIRVYDAAGNVIETHEHAGEFKEP